MKDNNWNNTKPQKDIEPVDNEREQIKNAIKKLFSWEPLEDIDLPKSKWDGTIH